MSRRRRCGVRCPIRAGRLRCGRSGYCPSREEAGATADRTATRRPDDPDSDRLDHDADGRLYEPKLREVAARALPPDLLPAVEAVIALQEAAVALEPLIRGVRNSLSSSDPRMRVLRRLHANPSGVPRDEL